MDTLSLPNNDNGSEVSDQDFPNYVVARFTPEDVYTKDDLLKFLATEFGTDLWVVGVEVVPKLHYHVVISTVTPFKEVKEKIRKQIYLWYPKRERGFGNKQWNCQEGDKTLTQAISYALKDRGDHVYHMFTEDFINECLEASYPKNSPSNFRVEYLELCEEFQESDMDVRSFMIKYSILKSKYNQQVRMQDAYGYALSNLIRRDPSQAENLVENFLYKL